MLPSYTQIPLHVFCARDIPNSYNFGLRSGAKCIFTTVIVPLQLEVSPFGR